jgi:hypothetical protein
MNRLEHRSDDRRGLSRRAVLAGAAALTASTCMNGRTGMDTGPAEATSEALGSALVQRSSMQEKFDGWLLGRMLVEGGRGDGLVYYYDNPDTGPTLLSLAVTAKACLYLLETGRPELARRCGEALLRFQVSQSGPQHLRGALPSEVKSAGRRGMPSMRVTTCSPPPRSTGCSSPRRTLASPAEPRGPVPSSSSP